MSTTNFGTGHAAANKLWSAKVIHEGIHNSMISKFIGGADSVIEKYDDAKKGGGDRIRIYLREAMTGLGVIDDDTLEGNEESLNYFTDDITIRQLRHGVRSAGKMSEQRVKFEIKPHMAMAITSKFTEAFDRSFFNQLGGITTADVREAGQNTPTAPTSNRIVYAGGQTTEASLVSTNVLSLDLLDRVKYTLEVSDPLIRPLKSDGEEYHVGFIHPRQKEDLRINTATGQWLDIQKAALQGGRISNNPLFTGALGMYNGLILHRSNRVPQAASANTRRAIFCGAQAGAIAFGRNDDGLKASLHRELFDYGNQDGLGGSIIYGLVKTVFNSEDYATLILATYAAD